jgi:tetratricopeptide (TPR) repeat protein
MPPTGRWFLPLVFVAACAAAQQEPASRPGPDLNQLRREAFAAANAGRSAAAADAFLALSRAEPGHFDWLVRAGDHLGRAGRYQEAVVLLRDAKTRFPGAVEVLAMLARTCLLQAENERDLVYPELMWAEAAEAAEQALRIDADAEDSRLVLAQARYLQGRWDDAVATAEEAVRRHPKRPGAHILIGRIATDRFRALLQQNEREQPTGTAAADLVRDIDRERQRAREAFRRAAELDPTRAHPHTSLAQLAWIDGDKDAARRHMLDALAIEPRTPVDHSVLTAELDWQGRRDLYRSLRERYEAGTTADPGGRAALWFHEGRANLDGGDWKAARAALEAALQHDAGTLNAHYYALFAAYRLGDHDGAEHHAVSYASKAPLAFADVLRELPADQRGAMAAILQFLADRAWQRQAAPVSRDLNHVLARLRDSADAWNNHAFLCRETGMFEAALQSYEFAIAREPESPQLWNDAAVVLQHYMPTPENFARARPMYEKALELAAKILASPTASAASKEAAAQARQNAQSNLAELPRD